RSGAAHGCSAYNAARRPRLLSGFARRAEMPRSLQSWGLTSRAGSAPLLVAFATPRTVGEAMSARHGEPLRGLMSSKRSPLFEGFFGRMFRPLRPATFGATEDESIANLEKLADQMTAGFDKPFDGKDPEESGIPALYTYLGQFIDHDLTFDPASSL